MAIITTNISVLDRVDGQPAIILPNQNFAVWSTVQNKYVDTGVKATPEDDSNAIKYFKLSKTSSVPSAPTQTGGWSSVTALDGALIASGWSRDPLEVSETMRFQFMAVYQRENISSPNAETGVIEFVPRFTYSKTALYNNFAPSPTISVDETNHTITITNPDGTKITTEFATTDGVEALTEIVKGLQKQVDKAIYSYEGDVAPTMSTAPVVDWLKGSDGQPITDNATKAEIFATHVGDLYYDKKAGTSYKFTIKDGGSASDPASYKWEVIANSALNDALKKLADLAGDTVKIWTETPTNGDSYKAGDLLLYKDVATGEYRYKHCVKANQPPQYLYSAADWVEPYATIEEVKDLRTKLTQLLSDFETAQGNITDLQNEVTNIKGTWIESIKDGIVTEQERANLEDTQRRIDEEQAQLQSNVNYILESPYFSGKDAFTVKANAVLAPTTGSIDKLQKAIADAIADSKITETEKSAVDSAFAVFHSTREALLTAIKEAKAEIDKQIPASVQVGGRNLITNFNSGRWHKLSESVNFEIDSDRKARIYGNRASASNRIAVVSYELEPNTEYLLSGDILATEGSYFSFRTKRDTVNSRSNYSRSINFLTATVGKKEIQFTTTSDEVAIYLEIGSDDKADSYDITIQNIKLEKGNKATDWTPAPEDVQYQIDAINANPPRINPTTKNWEVYKFVDGVGKYVDTGDTSVGDAEPPKIIDGYWWVYDSATKTFVNSGIKAIGEGGLVCTLNRQGNFRTSYRVVDTNGNILPEPTPIKYVEGGVNGKVVITASIKKGVVDVTARAKANGGAFKWLLNGTQIASGTEVLTLGVGDHVDGKTDEIEFQYDDTRANEW